MLATHFGAGNIGRGFIGETLFKNNFKINFVDINEQVIATLKKKKAYTIELANDAQTKIAVQNVTGLNNQLEPQEVIHSIAQSELVTTAIGPNILPLIAELIAQGIQLRIKQENYQKLDIIACENMIGGSDFLFEKVSSYLSAEEKQFVAKYIGFPNAAVDRIVPNQSHDDPLFVVVEPFKEWVIESTKSQSNERFLLEGVKYVEDLTPYIERKLFSVNTGHATVAYTGAFYGYETVVEALEDKRVLDQVKAVLSETSELLVAKWKFDKTLQKDYVDTIIGRFQNPHIVDEISRVARTPLRKLGYDERFVRPIRELKERNLTHTALSQVVALILFYRDPEDAESNELNDLLNEKDLQDLLLKITKYDNQDFFQQVKDSFLKFKRVKP